MLGRITELLTLTKGRRIWESRRTIKKFERTWHENQARKEVYDLIANFYRPRVTLLDGGCGIGFDAKRILERFDEIRYTGVDYSRSMIVHCKRKFSEYPNASFSEGDISKLEYPDKHFDIVISCNVLVHIPNFVKALEELCRVCKSCLILQFNYIQDREYLAELSKDDFNRRFLDRRSKMYFVYHNPQEITEMCSRLGFARNAKKNFYLDKYKREATVMQFRRMV